MNVIRDRTWTVIVFAVKVVVATQVYTIYWIKGGGATCGWIFRMETGPTQVKRRPVCSALERPDAIPLPATQHSTAHARAVSVEGHFPNVVEREAMTNIED